MEFEAQKGQRVEAIEDFMGNVKIGMKGTIDDHAKQMPAVKWDNGTYTSAIYTFRLKLINDNIMNDTDKIELTVADVKAGYAKGCSTGKAMVEAMFPKVFDKEEKITFRGDTIYLGDQAIGNIENDECLSLWIDNGYDISVLRKNGGQQIYFKRK